MDKTTAKENVTVQIGGNMVITYEGDANKDSDRKFAARMRAVAATRPANLQEFITGLDELMRRHLNTPEQQPGKGALVFVGVIPAVTDAEGNPYRTDKAGHYPTNLMDCLYQCQLNGGADHYYYIEERPFFPHQPPGQQLGKVLAIHHYNEDLKATVSRSTRHLAQQNKGRHR